MARSDDRPKAPKIPKAPRVPKTPKVPKEKKSKEPRAPREKRGRSGLSFSERVGDLFRNRVFVGVTIIILCSLAVFVASPLLSGLVSKRVPVVILTQPMEKGHQITQESVALSTIAEIDRPLNAATDTAQVIGTYASLDLLEGDILTNAKLIQNRPLENPYLYELAQGKIALSVKVQGLAEGLTGKLKAGDIVTVYAIFNNPTVEEDVQAITYSELKYVKVLASTNAIAEDIDVDSPPIEGTEREIIPATLTLEVGEFQGATLAGLNKNATIHVGLVARADEEEFCSLLLAAQDEYITALEEEEEAAAGESAVIKPKESKSMEDILTQEVGETSGQSFGEIVEDTTDGSTTGKSADEILGAIEEDSGVGATATSEGE